MSFHILIRLYELYESDVLERPSFLHGYYLLSVSHIPDVMPGTLHALAPILRAKIVGNLPQSKCLLKVRMGSEPLPLHHCGSVFTSALADQGGDFRAVCPMRFNNWYLPTNPSRFYLCLACG